ncbi:hypothetical protein BXP70_24640 [Hymenobacter crusticola]|uniref:Uncharacterized protein n=2 Tax=Hymenobacter crusticola TaxID=1770526 RepID=A0A243W6X3_9BACT|nr:hypothetical protein BXP70_24640 [Hymenobacter crusticola]
MRSGPLKATYFIGPIVSILTPVHQHFIFQPGGRASFRATRGSTVMKDSPLGWRLVGDSLFLQPGPVLLEAEGETQRIEREPLKHAVLKVAGGID